MINKIIEVLVKYEDNIMENTLGSYKDEYGERYVDVYSYEWYEHKQGIAYTINELLKYGININAVGIAYIIINEWCGVMTFDEGDLNMSNLMNVCNGILIDIVSMDKG